MAEEHFPLLTVERIAPELLPVIGAALATPSPAGDLALDQTVLEAIVGVEGVIRFKVSADRSTIFWRTAHYDPLLAEQLLGMLVGGYRVTEIYILPREIRVTHVGAPETKIRAFEEVVALHFPICPPEHTRETGIGLISVTRVPPGARVAVADHLGGNFAGVDGDDSVAVASGCASIYHAMALAVPGLPMVFDISGVFHMGLDAQVSAFVRGRGEEAMRRVPAPETVESILVKNGFFPGEGGFDPRVLLCHFSELFEAMCEMRATLPPAAMVPLLAEITTFMRQAPVPVMESLEVEQPDGASAAGDGSGADRHRRKKGFRRGRGGRSRGYHHDE